MPWEETRKEGLRLQFVAAHGSGTYSMTELCELYGISRPTGYALVARYEAEGVAGLVDRSRAPRRCPHRMEVEVREALLEARRQHPTWGPKKLLPWLGRQRPELELPARSTVGALLRQEGLTEPVRRRRRLEHPGRPVTQASEPNALWAADFKGQFLTRDGVYCYPLTVTDQASRYLLGCTGLGSTNERDARAAFERLFREYGLPLAIRTDNGVPFASTALGRLSTLSVWWIKLGVRPELTQPAHPEQNGQHERMHRTLKAETTRPPAADRAGQQALFDRFREEFNCERPHEALCGATPGSLYRPSPRPYPTMLTSPEYPGHFQVRRVSRNGGVRWNGEWINISSTLREEHVGFEETQDGIWSVYFGPVLLGRFDERDLSIHGVRYPEPKKRPERETKSALKEEIV